MLYLRGTMSFESPFQYAPSLNKHTHTRIKNQAETTFGLIFQVVGAFAESFHAPQAPLRARKGHQAEGTQPPPTLQRCAILHLLPHEDKAGAIPQPSSKHQATTDNTAR